MLELREIQVDNAITDHSKESQDDDAINDAIKGGFHQTKISESKSLESIKECRKTDTTPQDEEKEIFSDVFAKQSEEEDNYKTCEEGTTTEEYNFEFVKRTKRRARQLRRSREDVGYVYREDTLRRRRRQTSAHMRPNTCRYRQDKNGNVRFFMLYERPADQERTIRNEIRESQGRRMPSRSELARRQKIIYRVARVIGTLAMLGITVLIVNVPSTNRNFRTSPKIAPYRHEQPTYKQDGSLLQDTNRMSETERKTGSNDLYDSSTTAVPTTDYYETTTSESLTTPQECCMPKCDIVARKSGMCDCLDYEFFGGCS